MATFLFDEIIFGPVLSRRLGNSLGINLLPTSKKVCNFNCLYCECGLTDLFNADKNARLPTPEEVRRNLEETLKKYSLLGKPIDTITFAGNGEPTLHPSFPQIIDETLYLRNKYFPTVKVAVLSNATLIGNKNIKEALQKIDFNILKLDSANEETIRKINCPAVKFSLEQLIEQLHTFRNNLTIQTLFVKGSYNDYSFDNSSDEELTAWLQLIRDLNPKLVMVYTIARDTPIRTIQKISKQKLDDIAAKVRDLGIPVTISS
jgi:wyosine [tRNA(Phe)-imidazoG37] synthetase (radical SAM superfamily)